MNHTSLSPCRRPLLRAASTLGAAAFLTLAAGVPPAAAQAPPQPAGLEVLHRSGQSFITWDEVADPDVEAYRVYRHDSPIDALNLQDAALLWELGPGSGYFHADRYYNGQTDLWGPRYFERYVLEHLGPELPAGRGFLAWTLAPEDFGGGVEGDAYYAVTSVDGLGIENVLDFGLDNTLGPVAESIAPPAPVLGKIVVDGKAEIYIQYLDLRNFNPTISAPNATNAWFGLDQGELETQRSIQYAYAYALFPPATSGCGIVLGQRPVLTVLHGFGGEKLRPYTWDPHPSWCSVYRLYPLDVSNTWWYGNARDHDYRQSLEVGPDDAIANFTEQRVLRMLLDLERDPVHGSKIDPERYYVVGHSMGGSGSLAFALRFPNVFAAAHTSQPMTDYQTAGQAGGFDWQPLFEVLFGAKTLDLPIELDGPEGLADHLLVHDGTPIWTWQNHRQTVAEQRGVERVPFGIDHSFSDGLMEFETQAEPFYLALESAGLCWAGELQDTGHIPSNLATLPASLAKISGGQPFWGFSGRRNESLPGFGEASGNPPLPPSTTGSFNDSLEWSSSWNGWDGPPLDEVGQWRMALRVPDGPARTVDLIPRRLQNFSPTPGWAYWATTIDVATGDQLSSGMVALDGDGLLTVENVEVRPDGTRVWIRPSLTGTPAQLSLATGGSHTLRVRLGEGMAGKLYYILGSLSGTSPGLPLGDWHLALNWDAYFQLLLTTPTGGVLSPALGFLSANGTGLAVFQLPAGLDPVYAGFVFNHAALAFDPVTLQVQATTNPVSMTWVP